MWVALLLFSGVSFLLYKLILKPSKNFWTDYNIPQYHTSSLVDKIRVFLGQKNVADFDKIAYDKMASTGKKFCGVVEMQQPILLVKDLDLVKKLLIKDFDYFVDRRPFVSNEQQKIMNKVVANLGGEEWKGVRASISPTFTTGKIRRMMEHFDSVSNEWSDHIKERILNKGKGSSPLPVNVHRESISFAVDAIAAAVFGMSAGTIRNPRSHFAKMAKQLSDFNFSLIVKFLLAQNFPKVMKLLSIPLFDVESLAFFQNILTQGLRERMEGRVKRNDFMQLVVEARKGELKSKGSDELSQFEKEAQLSGQEGQGENKRNYLNDDDTAIAQAFVFFFAGFSTTSNFIGSVLYVLALHPEVQQKLREEVDSHLFSKGDGKTVDYDVLNGLTYLDMVICEVLRTYPPAGRLERVCVKDYHDPTENLRVPKGAMIGIPIDSIHRDKQFYQFPDQFYPEHFSAENKAKRNPYAFMPFGIGPRNCIGMRFALVESKAAVAHLVHSFKIQPSAKTPVPIKVKNIGMGVQIPDDLELGFSLLS